MTFKSSASLLLASLLLAPLLYFVFHGQSSPILIGSDSSAQAHAHGRLNAKAIQASQIRRYINTGTLPREVCSIQSSNSIRDITPYNVQMVYAYPKGASNKIKRLRFMINDDARYLDGFMRSQSSNRLSVAWDLGGECSETKYLDIRTYEMPHTASYYKSISSNDLYKQLAEDFDPIREKNKHFIVYADNTIKTSFRTPGFGEIYEDNSTGLDNENNSQSNIAWILGTGKRNFIGYPYTPVSERRATLIHEFVHTLGAVLPEAPQSTPGFHCLDKNDVMCYNDHTSDKKTYVRCGKNILRLDCGKDTYFNPNPERTGWIGENWNTADSPYLYGSRLRAEAEKEAVN